MYGFGITQPLKYSYILQIYWIYKQLIQLLDGRSILDKLVFQFQDEVQRVFNKLVLVTYPLYHSERIYNPSNFGIIQKPTILNVFLFTTIT